MQMQLTPEEKSMLKNALDHYLLELTGEIGSTDNRDFKNDLKHEKEILSVLMSRLTTE